MTNTHSVVQPPPSESGVHYDVNFPYSKLLKAIAKLLSSAFKDQKVQVGKDQEKAQSEKDSNSKNRGGKK